MNPFQQIFFPIFGAGCLVGAALSWFAAGRRIPGRVLLLFTAWLIVWSSMHLRWWLPGRCGEVVCLGCGVSGEMPLWLAGQQVG
jgi:hypothetical protein